VDAAIPETNRQFEDESPRMSCVPVLRLHSILFPLGELELIEDRGLGCLRPYGQQLQAILANEHAVVFRSGYAGSACMSIGISQLGSHWLTVC